MAGYPSQSPFGPNPPNNNVFNQNQFAHTLAPHPGNGQPITETNRVGWVQARQLALTTNTNPFEFIKASASTTDKTTIHNFANALPQQVTDQEKAQANLPIEMFDHVVPDQVPSTSPRQSNGTSYPRNTNAEHFKRAANIERMHQLLRMPYILAVNPAQHLKNYQPVMRAAFKKWIERVKLFLVQVEALKPRVSAPAVVAQVQHSTVNDDNLTYWWRKFSEGIDVKMQHDTRWAQQAEFAAQDQIGKRILKARYSLEILKGWTKEWEDELVMFETQFFASGGVQPRAAPGAPPFDPMSPQDKFR